MGTHTLDWRRLNKDFAERAQGKKLILWIDDDEIMASVWIEAAADALGTEYCIITCGSADAVLEFTAAGLAKEFLPHIVMVVWDMMMASAIGFTQAEKTESQDGTRTGIVLHRRLREVLPNIPFVQFSVVSDPEVVRPYMTPPDHSFDSGTTLPFEFSEKIRAILGLPQRSQAQGDEDKILKRIFGLLLEWWNDEAGLESGMAAFHHPAYRSIIALGRELGRPWQRRILYAIQKNPSRLYMALGEIMADNPYPVPFPAEKIGNIAFLTECWLAWGRKQGLIA